MLIHSLVGWHDGLGDSYSLDEGTSPETSVHIP